MKRCLMLLTLLASGGVAAADYELVDLGKLRAENGARITWPTRINASGEIVGEARVPDEPSGRAFRLRDGKLETLAQLTETSGARFRTSKALDINDAGVAVGYSTKGSYTRPAIWEPGKPVRELVVATQGDYAAAAGISNSGLIVGSFVPTERNMAFLWQKGELIQLGTLGPNAKGVNASYATAVNDKGVVIGQTSHVDGFKGFKPFIWEAGKMRELPMLPGDTGDGANAMAVSINAAGQVAGCAGSKSAGGFFPVIWEPDGTVRKLAQPKKNQFGAIQGCAYAINSNGVAVGDISTPDGDVAFVWDAKGGLRDLNDSVSLLWTGWKRLRSAHAINDRGEILGFAESAQSPSEPFLLRPGAGWRRLVAPILLGLLALGLGATLALWSRRRGARG